MKPKRAFAAAKQADGDLLLYVYDDIGSSFWSDGVTAKGIAAELAKAGKIGSITMRINSPGGDVFEGLTIFNLIRSQGVPVRVMVDGLAASAASLIAMAGDNIIMADNALLMIHNAWTVAVGDANEMRKTADTLDKVSGTLVGTYARRTGQAEADVQAMMDAETWLNAEEAVAKGFATATSKASDEEAAQARALTASFDLARRFANAPESLLAVAEPEPEPEAPPPDLSALSRQLLEIELAALA